MKSLFGYIIVNKPEMKFKEFDLYHAYYCGLCRSLKKCYGMAGQISLRRWDEGRHLVYFRQRGAALWAL